jgi:hypothetical protein
VHPLQLNDVLDNCREAGMRNCQQFGINHNGLPLVVDPDIQGLWLGNISWKFPGFTAMGSFGFLTMTAYVTLKRVPKIERSLIQSENARKGEGNDKASPRLLQCAVRKIG